MSKYLSAGEFAKIACTTKRTIHYYDEKGILRPVKTDKNGYRYYTEDQVLDYQKILLLTTLGITIDEIREYIKKEGNLTQLFNNKKSEIKAQIENLEFNLESLEKYSRNIKQNGTMVKPITKRIKPLRIFYIDKIGPYAKIAEYCDELSNMFINKGKNFTTLAIFENTTYQPKKSRIKVGVIESKGMKVRMEYKETIKYIVFDPGKVITHTHNGSGSILSLFWKELEKYCSINKIKIKKDVPDFEIYRKVSDNPSRQFFEIYLPIE